MRQIGLMAFPHKTLADRNETSLLNPGGLWGKVESYFRGLTSNEELPFVVGMQSFVAEQLAVQADRLAVQCYWQAALGLAAIVALRLPADSGIEEIAPGPAEVHTAVKACLASVPAAAAAVLRPAVGASWLVHFRLLVHRPQEQPVGQQE